MNFFTKKTKWNDVLEHETKSHVLFKFLMVLSIFVWYFWFIAYQYWLKDWVMVSVLTWSFFVLCTPVADAWFLIDFPLRLITRIKMLFSEMLVWIIAISLNLYAFFINPEIYEKTELLSLFKHILSQPLPFWIIIFISLLWTFVSIHFWDELMDKVKHKDREVYHKHKYNYQFIVMIFIFTFTIVSYDYLLKQLWVNMPV